MDKKMNVLVVDDNRMDLSKLVFALNGKCSAFINATKVTEDTLEASLQSMPEVDMILISDMTNMNVEVLLGNYNIAYLTDRSGVKQTRGEAAIFRYQSIDEMYKQIAYIHSMNASGAAGILFDDVINGVLSVELTERVSLDMSALNMLMNNYIDGLVPAQCSLQNDRRVLFYNVSNLIPLRDYVSRNIGKKQFLGVLEGLVNTLEHIEEYLLDSQMLFLNMNYMYVNSRNGKPVFICLPVKSMNTAPVRVKELIREMVSIAHFNTNENVSYVTSLIQYANQPEDFSKREFDELLKALANEKMMGDGSQNYRTPQQSGKRFEESANGIHGYLVREKTNELIPLEKKGTGVFRIGKEEGYADYVVMDNPAVSRKHATIMREGDKFFLIDTNSKNHVYINGAMIQPTTKTPLLPGAKVRLGNEEFIFKIESDKR